MTTHTMPVAGCHEGSLADTLQSLFAGLLKNVRVRLARRAAKRDLFFLDDRMLNDIGLRRGDLARAAMTSALVHRNGR